MPHIDYDSFRTKSWDERVSLFNAVTAEERAELVRTHLSRWLSNHRQELTAEQISILEADIAFIRPEMYELPRDEDLVRQFADLAKQTIAVLSPDQARDALTMHWDRSCNTKAR